jgi:hypothetical protein
MSIFLDSNNYGSAISSGPFVTYSGTISAQLQGSFNFYNNFPMTGSSGPASGSWWTTTGGFGSNPIINFPPVNNGYTITNTITGTFKKYGNLFFNEEEFLTFVVTQLEGRAMIFVEGEKERPVAKDEALHIILEYFLSSEKLKIKNWDDFQYKDDEWHLFFRKAVSSDELLQSFSYSREQIKKILCL